jgi:hypothetical protein
VSQRTPQLWQERLTQPTMAPGCTWSTGVGERPLLLLREHRGWWLPWEGISALKQGSERLAGSPCHKVLPNKATSLTGRSRYGLNLGWLGTSPGGLQKAMFPSSSMEDLDGLHKDPSSSRFLLSCGQKHSRCKGSVKPELLAVTSTFVTVTETNCDK